MKEVVQFEPYTICICIENSTTNQTQYKLELSRVVRPGQEISVQANVCIRRLTDSHHYAIRAVTTTHNETTQNGTEWLGIRQDIQVVTKPCDTLTYSVLTTNKYVIVRLSHDTITSTVPTLLKLTILPCSQGFKLNSSLKCNCTDYLLSTVPGITCNTTTNLLYTPPGIWIGNYMDGKLVAHLNCPLNYCKINYTVDLLHPDLQCTNKRSGVLCGACKAGLSLTLGTARCVDYCSNYYLFLVIPIGLAGMLLIFLLLKRNLTVSVGTINALIFYANIIHVNETIFFHRTMATTFQTS